MLIVKCHDSIHQMSQQKKNKLTYLRKSICFSPNIDQHLLYRSWLVIAFTNSKTFFRVLYDFFSFYLKP